MTSISKGRLPTTSQEIVPSEQSKEFDKLSNQVIGAAIEVHKTLGPGFLESVYHRALVSELDLRDISCETEYVVEVRYKENLAGVHMIDLLVDRELVVELKSVTTIADVHVAQLISYLKATGLRVGLIINFGKSTIDLKRIVYG